jgi:hypothetical protein
LAIELLKPLTEVEHPYKFIPYCLLGEIYNDVEQIHDSVNSYRASLNSLMALSPLETNKYALYLMLVYNNLGLSYINRDENDQGLGCIVKAEQVY